MLTCKRIFPLFLFILALPVNTVMAQEGCFQCNADSLAGVLTTTTSVDKRIELLELLAMLRLPITNSKINDTASRVYLQALVELGKSRKIKNIDAYKSMLDGLLFYEKKNYQKAQDAFKQSISLFDKSHKKISRLLVVTRLTYDEIGNQEARYTYYREKLQHYLINGPIENVASSYYSLGGYYFHKADYDLAISTYLRAADLYKGFAPRISWGLLGVVAQVYTEWGNYKKALEYFNLSIPMLKGKDSLTLTYGYINVAGLYLFMKDYHKSLTYSDSALQFDTKKVKGNTATLYVEKAAAYIGLGQLDRARENLERARAITDSFQLKVFSSYGRVETDFEYYQYYTSLKQYDKAIASLLTAYKNSIAVNSNQLQLKYLKELSHFYGDHNQSGLAFTYARKYYDLMDEIDRNNSDFKIAQYETERIEIKQKDSLNLLNQRGAVQAAIIKKNDGMLWGSLAALMLISTSLFFVYRQYRLNRKTLLSLRKTQRQLIVAEKMASLGEITAGIAHEIQNPLNFVTNFSEVNRELIEEMKNELYADNKPEAISIANRIDENEKKINHHGLRADAIVKGMLQHSREGIGQKETTELNELVDEYLRLSYQGFRAKYKSFQANVQTNLDPAIGKVDIVRQDIGRVLLNLYNNAFYTISSKALTAADGSYQPTISVSTKKIHGKVEIRVRDNGNGISPAIKEKIFQPFFTTKPAGQGTGLGLSLAYDIIKAHGGKIEVESNEGEGSTFVISIPV